jgi:hypothetical protein
MHHREASAFGKTGDTSRIKSINYSGKFPYFPRDPTPTHSGAIPGHQSIWRPTLDDPEPNLLVVGVEHLDHIILEHNLVRRLQVIVNMLEEGCPGIATDAILPVSDVKDVTLPPGVDQFFQDDRFGGVDIRGSIPEGQVET